MSHASLQVLEEKSEKISFLCGEGRIPLKIGSSFSAFTAHQWRLWVTVLSPIVLKGILPNEYLLLFVRCCTILCSRIISVSDIHAADLYLIEFCSIYMGMHRPPQICTFTYISANVYLIMGQWTVFGASPSNVIMVNWVHTTSIKNTNCEKIYERSSY